jgi:hypothetical protein
MALVQSYTKISTCVTLYMPLWTWEEINTCRELIYPTVTLELAWLLFSMLYGGSPCAGPGLEPGHHNTCRRCRDQV